MYYVIQEEQETNHISLEDEALQRIDECSWHEQLPDVVGMRDPQRTTTSVRQKMTVISKIRGSSTSERLMHQPGDLERDSLTNWQPVQLP